MQSRNLLIVLIITLLLIPNSLAGNTVAGEDVNPTANDVPFSILERTSPSVDGATWSLSIVMNDDAHDNGTTFEITTQVCTNDGVCDPPVPMDATVDGKNHSVSVTPPSDHTYVNWRVKAIYSDDNYTNYPNGDWYKTWSSCYFQQDSGWGGADFDGEECQVGENTPGFGLAIGVTSVAMAVAFTRRD